MLTDGQLSSQRPGLWGCRLVTWPPGPFHWRSRHMARAGRAWPRYANSAQPFKVCVCARASVMLSTKAAASHAHASECPHHLTRSEAGDSARGMPRLWRVCSSRDYNPDYWSLLLTFETHRCKSRFINQECFISPHVWIVSFVFISCDKLYFYCSQFAQNFSQNFSIRI